MKKYLLFLCLALFFYENNIFSNEKDLGKLKYSHYDVQLKIIPNEQFIRVDGSLKYLVMQDSLNELTFNLHKEFVLNNFSVNGDSSYQIDTSKSKVRWQPDVMKIVYLTENKFKKEDILNIEFSYKGKITQWPSWSANVIGPDWVEIGLYFPWYPSISSQFTYKVSVDIEAEYKVFAIGNSTGNDNKRVFETEFPVNDFIICSSKDLMLRETQLLNQSFQIVNSTLSEAIVDSIQTDIENFYKSYSKWFGQIQVQNMCLVVSKREKGGGYSRKGGLFLGGLSNSSYLSKRIEYVQYIAHEISHFWWHGASSNWEDWLNESFAEYSALLLVRELYSKDEYNFKISAKRNESKNTPPIWGISRSDPQATQVLYSKGVVLLSELEQKMGTDKFIELCKARIYKNVNTTEDFLNLITYISEEETTNWFEQSLKNQVISYNLKNSSSSTF